MTGSNGALGGGATDGDFTATGRTGFAAAVVEEQTRDPIFKSKASRGGATNCRTSLSAHCELCLVAAQNQVEGIEQVRDLPGAGAIDT